MCYYYSSYDYLSDYNKSVRKHKLNIFSGIGFVLYKPKIISTTICLTELIYGIGDKIDFLFPKLDK
jgi:hypothetical protein